MTSRLRALSVQFDVARQVTLEATHRALVATALREHAKVMRADPAPSSFRRFVDGHEGAAEESVKPTGVIEYHYQRIDEIVRVAMDTLFDLSPVLSGDYRRAHTLFVGGAAVSDLSSWKPEAGEEIYILNPLVYARKIELGKMKMRVSGTEKVYQQAAQVLKRRYGNMAAIKFTFRSVVDGSFFAAGGTKGPIVRGPKGRFAKGSHARAGRKQEADARRPALYIRIY